MATTRQTAKKPATPVVQKKKYAPSDLITCRSMTHGTLVLVGKKSALQYTWANYGDTTEVEYQDLQALYATRSRFLVDPLFIIEDDELVDTWKSLLQPVYDKIVSDNLDDMLELSPERLRVTLMTSPPGIKKSIATLAAAKIQNGELDSINRIRVLDEVLGTEFAKFIF